MRNGGSARARYGGLAALLIGGAVLGAALAGCSGGPAGTVTPAGAAGAAAQAAPAAAVPPERAAALGPAASGGAGRLGVAGTTARVAPASQIVYTAQLTVRAQDVIAAASRAARIAGDAGGYVSDETASSDPGHPSRAAATVQLKIPVAAYPAALGRLASGLGTQLSLRQQARDVTEQVADVTSQVASDEAAIAQLRALLARAGSVAALLDVQNQIDTEESGLESLQAEQRALSHETSYATVSVTIVGPPAAAAPPRPAAPPSLAGGLGAGWHALRTVVSWTLAFLGAVAPFAAVLAVAGYLVYRGRRWALRRRPAAGGPARG
ncbi:MAG TPA: DUF4349 domain-containing protein [Streptosporangiaceae bacterium]|nr:DUF4349 domain-containing protein [Streptosporangiaceae bacterium]